MATYTSQYPTQDASHVKATTTFSANYLPYFATDPTRSLIGSYSQNEWICGYPGITGEQRFHIDLGSEKMIRRIYLENGHHYGTETGSGIKNFIFQGSNKADAFNNLTYSEDTDWTTITTLQANAHVYEDIEDPQYFVIDNTELYQYYALKIIDNWEMYYIQLRRVELQEEDDYSPSASPSPSSSISLSSSLSPSPSSSISASPSLSPSPSSSISLSSSLSSSLSISLSPSLSPSPSASISFSPSLSPSPSASISLSPSRSPSRSISLSLSRSPSISISLSPSKSISLSPSTSPSASLGFFYYRIQDCELPRPKVFSRQFLSISTNANTLTGKLGRDIKTIKEKFILQWELLSSTEIIEILTIINKYTTFEFEVDDGNLQIPATTVIGRINTMEYSTVGDSYYAQTVIELEEVQ